MTSTSSFNERKQGLTITEVSEQTGLSQDTLRYYEKAGLIEHVDRTSGNHRCYAPNDLDWIAFLLRLRETGMSIGNMQRFAQLRSSGSASVGILTAPRKFRAPTVSAHQRCVERDHRGTVSGPTAACPRLSTLSSWPNECSQNATFL